jgi:uridine kinase
MEHGTTQRPCLVAIVGGSGAGKSWLADRLRRLLGTGVSRLSLDDFYRDRSHLPARRRGKVNFDHPRAIDWLLLREVLAQARQGNTCEVPRYDFSTHTRRPKLRRWRPRRLVLCDGLWLLWQPSIRALFDLRLFVCAPAPVRLRRRLRRDKRERGRDRESVVRQFRGQVAPMHQRFVAPQQRWADLILRSPVQPRELNRLAKLLTA